jgi:hypothetical protein
MNNGAYFHFTEKIKYLGLWATTDLKDKTNVPVRMAKGYGLMGALKELFRSTEVPLGIKYKMYVAIPLNAELWGCESWATIEAGTKTIEVFHHKAIRKILGIPMKIVREERISNAEIRKRFMSIPKITDFVTRSTLRYIGKTIQNEDECAFEKQCITVYFSSP